MAYSIVQSKTVSGNSGTHANFSLNAASTAGNLLVLIVMASKNPGAVTFTPPTGFTQVGTTQDDPLFVEISGAVYYYANNPGGITSMNTTFSSTVSGYDAIALEISGVTTSSSLDAGTLVASTSGSNHPSVSVTTASDGDLLIGIALQDEVNGAVTVTEPAGSRPSPRSRTQAGGAEPRRHKPLRPRTARPPTAQPSMPSTMVSTVSWPSRRLVVARVSRERPVSQRVQRSPRQRSRPMRARPASLGLVRSLLLRFSPSSGPCLSPLRLPSRRMRS
jgi:hypothetical protein